MLSATSSNPTPPALPGLPGPETKAKRTHARRSCEVCKLRKTRCELPDLDVPSSTAPLPGDKACHRCRILALPCIVDDSSRKIRKRPREEEGSTPKRKPRASKAKSGDIPTLHAVDDGQGIDHTLDILHGLNPSQTPDWTEGGGISSVNLGRDVVEAMNRIPQAAPDASNGVNPIKLHGRPLELVCAMLGVAYGKKGMKRPGVEEGYDVELDTLLSGDLRARIEHGVSKLQALHPFLESLNFHFNAYATEPSPSVSLLLALIIYLATLALAPTDDVTAIRATLTPFIINLRDTVLLHLPPTFVTIQALQLLAVHAPLGVLPFQSTNPRSLAVARGQVVALQSISTSLNFKSLLKHCLRIGQFGGPPPFDSSDVWLWLEVCTSEACLALEDEVVRKPPNLAEAKDTGEGFLAPDFEQTWRSASGAIPVAELIGRLGVCDRVWRLNEVIDSIGRIRMNLDTVANDPNFDAVTALTEEMRYLTERLDQIDGRHDAVLGILSHVSQGIESGRIAYRGLRRRYETNKVYVQGVRALIATAYIPGCHHAFPGLPTNFTGPQKVSYAWSRALNPSDILTFCMTQNNPAVQAVWTWGKHRGEICESTLVAFVELGQMFTTATSRDHDEKVLVPLHNAMCIAVESAKVLMEMQAGSIAIHRSDKRLSTSFRVPTWLYPMRQVSDILRQLDSCSSPRPADDKESGRVALESVVNGCSNLFGSMIRLADEWNRTHENDDGEKNTTANDQINDLSGQSQGQSQNQLGGGLMDYTQNLPEQDQQQTDYTAGPSNPQAPLANHPYMDSSDRWMASDHQPPQFDAGPSGYEGQPPAPTPLDLLLSHMFNYSSSGHAAYQPQQQAQHDMVDPALQHAGHQSGHMHQSHPMSMGGSGHDHQVQHPAHNGHNGNNGNNGHNGHNGHNAGHDPHIPHGGAQMGDVSWPQHVGDGMMGHGNGVQF